MRTLKSNCLHVLTQETDVYHQSTQAGHIESARLKRRTSPPLVPVWTPTATIDPSLLMATALAVPLVLYCQRGRCCQNTRAGMMGSDAIKTTTSSLLINAVASQVLNR